MKRLLSVLFIIILMSVSVLASDIDIEKELNTDKLDEIVPESLKDNENFADLNFSYSTAPNAVSVKSVIDKFLVLFFKGLTGEISFFTTVAAFLISSSVYSAFSSNSKSALSESVNFAVSVFLCVILYSHVLASVDVMTSYVRELTGFMASLLPFLATAMCIQGTGAQAVTGTAILLTVITLIERVCVSVVIPLVKVLFAFICASFISKVNFSPLTDFVTAFASKTCTVTMSIISAILYFQQELAASSDSMALRSIKLAAGNFIPIVGSMVSEASATVIAGVKLVKSTMGMFAFAVLLYMTLVPIIFFLTRKITLKLLSALSSLLGCDSAAKIISSVYGVYHIMSALMFSVCTFFIIAVAIFVKSGGV